MSAPPVTLQISLAPSDFRHAALLLPHQVRTWRSQVSEIVLTLDFHRSAGRFSAGWEEGRAGIEELAQKVEGARVLTVDYGAAAHARISAAFFGGKPVPLKDCRGGPYYAYFFGLCAASHDHVLHLDSDIFCGGGSGTWISEALAAFRDQPAIFCTAPLPGPPAADGRLHSQRAEAEAGVPHAFHFRDMSTRVFLFSRERFHRTIGALHPRPPGPRQRFRALVDGNPPEELPEQLFSEAMQARGLVRREFLGSGPGMWTLHPPYRGSDFYGRLPSLIRSVETGNVPPAQRGCHDFNSSMVDWSEGIAALEQNRWWRRLARRLGTRKVRS